MPAPRATAERFPDIDQPVRPIYPPPIYPPMEAATLVCEVRYDHFSGGRFRHGTRFLRWRPDKAPAQCTDAQGEPLGSTPPARKAG